MDRYFFAMPNPGWLTTTLVMWLPPFHCITTDRYESL